MSRKRSSTYLIFGTDTADKNLILERYPEPSRKVAAYITPLMDNLTGCGWKADHNGFG